MIAALIADSAACVDLIAAFLTAAYIAKLIITPSISLSATIGAEVEGKRSLDNQQILPARRTGSGLSTPRSSWGASRSFLPRSSFSRYFASRWLVSGGSLQGALGHQRA